MKLAIIVRKDLGMRTGKIAVQVGHASVEAYYHVANSNTWYFQGQKKIVFKIPTLKDLLKIESIAENSGLAVFEIRDFGLTQVEPNTLTCIAIGPDEDEKIDKICEGLKLL